MPSMQELFELQEGPNGVSVRVKHDKQTEYQQLIDGLKDIQQQGMDNGVTKAFKRQHLKACELVIATYLTLEELDDYVDNQWLAVAKDTKHFLLAQVEEDNQYHLIAVNFRHRVIREELSILNSRLGNLSQLILPLLASLNHNDQPEHKKLSNQIKEHIADELGYTRIKVFLSYAWASEEYKDTFEQDKFYQACVEQIAFDLEKAGLAVFLDIWCDVSGKEVTDFLQRAFSESHYILVIGTRLYSEKYQRTLDNPPSFVMQNIGRLDLKKPEHVLAFEVTIMQELSTHSQKLRNKILPLFLEKVEGTFGFPFLLDKKIPNFGDKDYYQALYGILKAAYQIDPKGFRVTVASSSTHSLAVAVDQPKPSSDRVPTEKGFIKDIIPIPNSAVQLFTGNNSKGPSHLDFKTWYHPEICHYLLQLVDNNAYCVQVVFRDTGYGDNTTTFKNQLEALILLASKLGTPAAFIAKAPGAEIRFISGLLKANQLVLINPLGMSIHQDCYQILAELQRAKILSTVGLSNTCLQRKDYEEASVSCGPISIELIVSILEKLAPDNLNAFWSTLKNNEPTYHEKTELEYIELSIESLLPKSLKNLLKASTKEEYQQQINQIRQTHYQLLCDRPEKFAAKDNISVKICLQQIREAAPSQVLFNTFVTRHLNHLDLDKLPANHFLREALNREFQKISSPLEVSAKVTTGLKNHYKNYQHLSLLLEDNIVEMKENYVSPEIIEKKEQISKEEDIKKTTTAEESEKKEDSEVTSDKGNNLRLDDKLYTAIKPIRIEDLFSTKEENDGDSNVNMMKQTAAISQSLMQEEARKILIVGRAGVGKSTLCQYIAISWQFDELWNDKFQAIFWLPLRNLLNQKDKLKLEDIIQEHCLTGAILPTIEELSVFIKTYHENILFILDGYDEVSESIDSDKNIGNLIKQVLGFKFVILTSRPNTNLSNIANMPVKFDKELEIIGFDNDDVEIYIKQYMSYRKRTHEGDKLHFFLKKRPKIYGIAHTPLCLELICNIQLDSNDNGLDELKTMTELYDVINQSIIERYKNKFGKTRSVSM